MKKKFRSTKIPFPHSSISSHEEKRERKRIWLQRLQRESKRDAEELSQVYKTLRYFIVTDVSPLVYIKNWTIPAIRYERLLTLEGRLEPSIQERYNSI